MDLSSLFPVIQGNPIPKTLAFVCSSSDLPCDIPNCPNMTADWYHVTHRRKIKGTERQKIITSYTAKQIPVCKAHRILIHNGKYDGPSLRKLVGFTLSDFKDLAS